jgi:hypothetical protein
MKKKITPLAIALAAVMFMSGCLALSLGGGSKSVIPPPPTVGQELIDLQVAKERGAITEAEFESQKARLLRAR